MRRIVAVWSSFAVAGVIVVAALAAPGSTQVVAKIDTGAGPCSEAGGFGSVWVGVGGAGSLARIDPATNAVTARSTSASARAASRSARAVSGSTATGRAP